MEAIDLPVESRHLDYYWAQLVYSDRPWNARGIGRRRVEDAIEMMALARGKTREALLGEPSLTCVINVNSPRRVDNELLAGLMAMAEAGQALIVTPKGDIAAAAKLMLAASPEDLRRQDTDEWWRERRTLARKLLDIGDAATAYQVVRNAAPPVNPYYRADVHFMSGWIALRFLADPATAAKHFAHVDDGMTDPLALARAAYWRGRAAEAAGQAAQMRAQYEAAAR